MPGLQLSRVEANRSLIVWNSVDWIAGIDVYAAPRIKSEHVIGIERQGFVDILGPSSVILLLHVDEGA